MLFGAGPAAQAARRPKGVTKRGPRLLFEWRCIFPGEFILLDARVREFQDRSKNVLLPTGPRADSMDAGLMLKTSPGPRDFSPAGPCGPRQRPRSTVEACTCTSATPFDFDN